jgi:tRNA(fMet)-specific endonuclease VapC
MPEYLLDTNIVSYFLKMPQSPLAERIRNAPAHSLCISTITEAELRYGIRRMAPEARMQKLVPAFLIDIQIEPWNSACAEAYAQVASSQRDSGKSISLFDLMIASHALARKMTLVTHDKAFAQVPTLRLEDWTIA